MIPLLGPLLALILGILASPYLDMRAVWICLPLTIFLGTPGFARRWCWLLALGLIGAGLRSREPVAPQPDPGDSADVASRVVGTIVKAPEWRDPGVYLDLNVLSIDSQPSRGRAKLTEFLDSEDLRSLFNALRLGSGDKVEIVVKLHRPALYGDPGVFNYRRYLERQQIYWTGSIRNPRLIQVIQPGWHGPGRIRNWLTRRLETPFQDDSAVQGLMMAVLLGRKYGLTAATERQFQAGGVYHLLVVSGLNFALAGTLVFWLIRRTPGIPIRRNGRLILVWLCILGYAAVADGQASLLRAGLMATFVVAGKLLDRGRSLGNSIAGTAILILMYSPSQIEDSSFQMTFAAVVAVAALGVPAISWAVGWLGPALRDFGDTERDARLPVEIADWRVARRLWCELRGLPFWTVTIPWRLIRAAVGIVILSLCIESVLAYFMVESFHRLSPISPFLSIPSAVLAAVIVPIGFALLVLPPSLARAAAAVASILLHAFLGLLGWALSFHFSNVRVPSAPLWIWAAYLVFLSGLIAAVRYRRWIPLVGTTAAVFAIQVTVMFGDFTPPPPKDVTLTFLDVGQGDSTLIEFPEGQRMLIDGGGVAAGRFLDLRDESTFSIGENVVSAYLFSRGIRKLDTLVLTHAHVDHLQGLLDVIENFKVGEIWLGRNPMVPAYRELVELIQAKQIPIRWVHAGQVLGPFTVLHPPINWQPRKNDENNDSVVLLLKAGGATALLTGDMERSISAPARVDLLKVPHHGSGGVKLHVEAPVRVISVGANNPFGHPNPSTLPALRTDKMGAITVVLAGGIATVSGSYLTNPCVSCKLTFLLIHH